MTALPGEDLVQKGLEDLSLGQETIEALLVSMAPSALRALGLSVPAPLEDPECKLFLRLGQTFGNGAHSRYNAYRRRLASYLRVARCVRQ
ncbi:MAG: hypothetical protein AB7I09_18885 [Planctomycetota bacterium]